MKKARAQSQVDVKEYWQFLTDNSEFHFCILGTQRANYGSLFFAYEDFLSSTIRTIEPNYTSKKDPIKEAMRRHFGELLTEFCWNHDEVDLARLVRHAIAHNGGRYRADLNKYKIRFVNCTGIRPLLRDRDFILVDGTIQITPGNVRYLFGVLKERVTRIVGELV